MNDFEKIISEEKPTLADFFASWCGPCKMQTPILEKVKAQVGGEANIIKVDIDCNSTLSEKYNVRSVPTLILFKQGKEVWRGVGVQSAEVLERQIRSLSRR